MKLLGASQHEIVNVVTSFPVKKATILLGESLHDLIEIQTKSEAKPLNLSVNADFLVLE
jgi:hypothetical protein